MVNIFDLLTNAGNKIKNNGLFERLINKTENFTPQSFEDYAENMKPLEPLPAIQFNEDGTAYNVNVPDENKGISLYERLVGRRAKPTDSIGLPQLNNDGETVISSTISENPRSGGILRDIAGGYNENRFTPASLENFNQNKTSDGRNKGFAYRLGEGLGSLARFGESPLGRSLIVGGLVGATGGNGLEALAYGGSAGALNQANKSADRIYRDDLIQSQQNALQNSPEFAQMKPDEQRTQMQAIADNINSQRGYINKDIYSNLINTQQIRDNADWKKMYFDTQQANLQAQRDYQKQQDAINNQFRQEQLEQQAADREATRAFNYYNANLNHQDRMTALNAQEEKQNLSAREKDAQGTLNQIALIRQLIKDNQDATGLVKGLIPGDLLNRVDNKNINIQIRTAIDALRTKIRHDLTGAQFSPKEAREYEKFLPNVRDNVQIINAKLDALEKRYYADFGINLIDTESTGSESSTWKRAWD